jgi:ATP-dependent DNA ligase
MPKITMELDILFKNALLIASSSIKRYNIPDIEIYKSATPYFAGELYKHGVSLNVISGQARKETSTIDLEYHIFDVFFPLAIERGHNMKSKYRQLYLDDLFRKIERLETSKTPKLQNIKRVENFKVHSMDEINTLVEEFIKDGYEGGIARKDNGIYRYSINNYHSKDVLKIKPTFDDEFPIVGFTQGTKGKDLGALIWICSLKDDPNTTFHVVPNMPIKERKELYTSLKVGEFTKVGKLLTVSYAELSPRKIPLQPKGIAVRDYE